MDELEEIEVPASNAEADDGPKRFCGRCQQWVPDVVELHFCVKAKRTVGYAWYEPDEPAVEKNSIIQESRPFKPGKLIERFEAEG